jgi:hypothetical protein
VLKRYSFPITVVTLLAVLVGTAVRAQELTGQDLKPVVRVAFSGYDDLISDLNFVGKLAGNPQLGASIEMSAKLATGGRELKSLDKSKPWGALVYADGVEIRILGFVPLGDLGEMREILAPTAAEIKDADDGQLAASFEGQTVYLKSEGGWVFVSNQPEGLDGLPKDPAAELGGLEKSYNLAVRLDVQNIPEMVRELLLGMLQSGLDAGMERMPGESEEQFALRTKMAGRTLEQVKTAVDELDSIQLGLAIDEETSALRLDIEATALPDTETAQRLTAAGGMATDFAGFAVAEAALSYYGVGRIEQADVDQILSLIDGFRTSVHTNLGDQGLPEDDEKTARQLVDDTIAVVTATVKQRDLDGGLLLLLDEKQATWLGGIKVADSSRVEDILKRVVEEAAREQPALKEAVQFNAEEHAGVQLHKLSIPTAALGDQQATELFGNELTVVLGVADQAVYLGIGTDATETLKKVIDDCEKGSDKELPPASLTISAGPVARFVGKFGPTQEAQLAAKMIADMLADAEGTDRLTITTTVRESGQRVRVEMEAGLLKLLGALPAIIMGAAPMGR